MIAGAGKHRKVVAVLIGLPLFFLLRWQALAGMIWTNAGMVEINAYPAWRSIVMKVEAPGAERVQETVRFNANSGALWRGWGLIHLGQGQADEALAIWRRAGLDPAQVAVIQGRYAGIIEQNDAAQAWFEYAVALDPERAEVWHELGEARQRTGKNEAARAAYAQALALGYGESADPLARSWRNDSAYDPAIEIWQSALDTFPDHAHRLRWWQGLTNSLRATGQWEAGVAAAEAALKEFPEDARLYVEYGAMLYNNGGDVNKAMNALNRAIELDETMIGAYSAAAAILASENEYRAAYEWYSQAAERDPENPSWYVAQGNMARATGELDLALEVFEAATTRFPNFAPAHYGIALVYQQLGEKENAAEAITQALQTMKGQDVQYFLRAGEIYEWSERSAEAIAAYRQAIQLDPNNAPAAAALQRLLDR